MNLQVPGEFVDPLGEDRDLDLGRARVALVQLILLDHCLFGMASRAIPGSPP